MTPAQLAAAQAVDSATLRTLRVQLRSAQAHLDAALLTVNTYLADGAPPERTEVVDMAMTAAPDRMNEIRALLGQVEPIIGRAEHPHRHKHGKKPSERT